MHRRLAPAMIRLMMMPPDQDKTAKVYGWDRTAGAMIELMRRYEAMMGPWQACPACGG